MWMVCFDLAQQQLGKEQTASSLKMISHIILSLCSFVPTAHLMKDTGGVQIRYDSDRDDERITMP